MLCVLGVTVLTGVMLLTSLELRRSYRELQRRTELLLCAKETKGELGRHLRLMGQTNWGIRNLKKLALITAFVPGLQTAAKSADEARKLLQAAQDLSLVSYLNSLRRLGARSCPMDPRLVMTPFITRGISHQRDPSGAAILRSKTCQFDLRSSPYHLRLGAELKALETPQALIRWSVAESAGRPSFPSP